LPISLKTDTHLSPTHVRVTRRVQSAGWVLLVLLPIPVTLLGVALAAVGGWLGIGLVVLLQASMVAALVGTADRPPPSRPAPPALAVETALVEDVRVADAGQPSVDPEA
jgi:hypothetical protein